jgi:hypothetical protein
MHARPGCDDSCVLTPEELAERTERAVAAATAAATPSCPRARSCRRHLCHATGSRSPSGSSSSRSRTPTRARGTEAEQAYDAAAVRIGLPRLDERPLRVMEAARMLQLVACSVLVPELPMLADGLRPALDSWRTTPPAGGLA